MHRTDRPHHTRMILWLALALLAATAPLPRVRAEAPVSAANREIGVLLNPDFEKGFSAPSDAEGVVGMGWKPWYVEGTWKQQQQGYLRPITYAAESRREYGLGRIHSEGYAQGQATTYATHTGGLYQRIPVIPGSTVSFSIWAYIWSSSQSDPDRSMKPGNYEVSVGIDPWGGSDGSATGVVWSRSLREYDRWIKLSISTVAKADAITVFTRGRTEWRVKHNCSYWDDASLQVVPPMGQALQGASTLTDQGLTAWEGTPEDLVGVLRNADFEEGFSAQGASEVTVADHWHPWWVSGAESETRVGHLRRPEYKPEDRQVGRGRVRSGARAQKQFTTYATHDAGIYQQVPVIPGSMVSFSIWAYVWSSSEDDADRSRKAGEYQVSVGIDPLGGTDGSSDSVVWSKSVVEYDCWTKLNVQTVAEADRVTVFTRGRPEWRVKHNDSYWDDATLQVQPATGDPYISWDSDSIVRGGASEATPASDTGLPTNWESQEIGRESHLLYANHRLTLEWWRASDSVRLVIDVPTQLEGELHLWENGQPVARWAIFVVPSDPLTVVWQGPSHSWSTLGAQVLDQQGRAAGQCGLVGVEIAGMVAH